MSLVLGAAGTGYAAGFSLILAIGAQNAFLIRHALAGHPVFGLCLFFALSDALLIAAGVAGFGAITEMVPWLPWAMTLLGAGFLLFYATLRLRAAWRGTDALDLKNAPAPSPARLYTIAALFTWANPHVYLDTMALLGALSMAYEGTAKLGFALGAISASFSFFFGLGYGARALAPYAESPRVWRALDLLIAVVLTTLAVLLLTSL